MSDHLRVFFTTDLHGSTVCFRKFLNSVKTDLKPDVLIVGGDITGKRLIPVFEANDGHFYTISGGKRELVANSEDKRDEFAKLSENQGAYTYSCDESTAQLIDFDEVERAKVEESCMVNRVKEWVKLAEQKLDGKNVKLIINTGNDDPFAIDNVLKSSSKIIYPEGKAVEIGNGIVLFSLGYSNVTPWKLPREESEPGLRTRIGNLIAQSTFKTPEDFRKAVFNFHCPPKGTELDVAIKVDEKTLKPVVDSTGTVMAHVGSEAVWEAIDRWQPCVGLHGHIHDTHAYDWVKKTKCFNPGSEYASGLVRGVFLDFSQAGELIHSQLTREDLFPSDSGGNEGVLRAFLEVIPGLKGFFHGRHEREVHTALDHVQKSLNKMDSDIAGLKQDVSEIKKQQKTNPGQPGQPP